MESLNSLIYLESRPRTLGHAGRVRGLWLVSTLVGILAMAAAGAVAWFTLAGTGDLRYVVLAAAGVAAAYALVAGLYTWYVYAWSSGSTSERIEAAEAVRGNALAKKIKETKTKIGAEYAAITDEEDKTKYKNKLTDVVGETDAAKLLAPPPAAPAAAPAAAAAPTAAAVPAAAVTLTDKDKETIKSIIAEVNNTLDAAKKNELQNKFDKLPAELKGVEKYIANKDPPFKIKSNVVKNLVTALLE